MRLIIFLSLLLVATASASSRKLPPPDDTYTAAERPYIRADSWDEAEYSVTFTMDKPAPHPLRKTETFYFKHNPRLTPVSHSSPVSRSFSVTDQDPTTMFYDFEFAARPIGIVVRVIGYDGNSSVSDKVMPFEQPIIIPWNQLTHTKTIDGTRYDAEVKWKKP